MSCVFGFTATFFSLWLNVTVQVNRKFLLVLKELFFCLEPLITFAASVGVDVIDHYWMLTVLCNSMVAESCRTREQGATITAGTSPFYAFLTFVFVQLQDKQFLIKLKTGIFHKTAQIAGIFYACYVLTSVKVKNSLWQ